MQMVGFGVEIFFGEVFSGSSDHCHAKQAIQFETNPEFFFFGSLPSCAELLRLLFLKLVSRKRCSQFNPVNTVGYRGDADSLFPLWCTTIFIL